MISVTLNNMKHLRKMGGRNLIKKEWCFQYLNRSGLEDFNKKLALKFTGLVQLKLFNDV